MNRWLVRGVIAAAVGGFAAVAAAWRMFAMPGSSYDGPMPDADQDLVGRLKRHVFELAGEIGERRVYGYADALDEAATYIESELRSYGLRPTRQTFMVGHEEVRNIVVELRGILHPKDIVVVGAHYDSAAGTPAANDNGSGVAMALELARTYATSPRPLKTLRFVFFVNEEVPFFGTDSMGSQVYATRASEAGERIHAMICLETIGYYTNDPGSQSYPDGVNLNLPDIGNFLAFVGNIDSVSLVRDVVGAFRAHAKVPSHGVSLPADVPGVGWSDHASFWRAGYKAVMVTDSAPYRYPHYHTERDTPDKLSYDTMALVYDGLMGVLKTLTR